MLRSHARFSPGDGRGPNPYIDCSNISSAALSVSASTARLAAERRINAKGPAPAQHERIARVGACPDHGGVIAVPGSPSGRSVAHFIQIAFISTLATFGISWLGGGIDGPEWGSYPGSEDLRDAVRAIAATAAAGARITTGASSGA